jgi:hypothetical protein
MSCRPQRTRPDDRTFYQQACPDETDGGQVWYRGTGIARSQHPLQAEIDLALPQHGGAGHCRTAQTEYLEWRCLL